MKYISKILAILLLVGVATSCQRDDAAPQFNNPEVEVGVFGDNMLLNLNIEVSDPIDIATRAVDPDGRTLQTLHLFCFDANGLFITTSPATIKSQDSDQLSGTFSAVVPKTTRIIHLLGNQNMSVFDKNAYAFKSEDDVLSALEGSAGMLIYWARIEAPTNISQMYTDAVYTIEDDGKTIEERTDAEAFVDWLTIETNPTDSKHRNVAGKGHPIVMLRNQARFTIVSEGDGADKNDPWKGDHFEVTGFVLTNTPAFGTVAPYDVDYGFPTYTWSEQPESAFTVNKWLEGGKVTSPARADKISDAVDVVNSREQFIFESNNLGTDPVDLILRGRNIKDGVPGEERYFYRVNLIYDDDAIDKSHFEGDFVKILRNHHYELHITANLTNGCETFEEALVAPPTNNIWLSISDEVSSVRDLSFVLSVEKTNVVVETNATGATLTSDLYLNFDVEAIGKGENEKPINPERLSVAWVDDSQKVSSTFTPRFQVGDMLDFDIDADGKNAEGQIHIKMNDLPQGVDFERGALVVKYGRLQRKIKIILLRPQTFVPTWVSSEVYGHVTEDESSRSNVTVVFSIPETLPEELFPFDVLITTNGLDGRAETGQSLPIVRAGDEGYGEEFSVEMPDGTTVTDIGYKYKFTVTEPGQKRVYFENIFNVADGDKEYVTVEAEYFERVTKMVTYVNYENNILLPNLRTFAAYEPKPGEEDPDAVVRYILVPQKRYAPIKFDIGLTRGNVRYVDDIPDDEFLLYSSNLDHITDTDSRLGTDLYPYPLSYFDCYFKPYASNVWSSGGRIFGFYPRDKQNGFWDEDDTFQIFMETNKPQSAEVVRVASNQRGDVQVKNPEESYNGATYRSVTFELANYRPFRFAAQVNGEGNYVADDATAENPEQNAEVVDHITFDYLPGQTVAVSFDVTSFKAQDGSSVDPFGTGFEIFIDAPMLTLEKGMNKSSNGSNKNFEDILVEMFDKDANGVGYTENKPKLEDLGNGRFVYRVDAYNQKEYEHWTEAPKIEDEYYNFPLYGERKTIYFKKNSIVSAGEITISANPDHVTYHSKTFKVSNSPLAGAIEYYPVDENDEESLIPVQVPFGQFVSFTRVADGSRIGSLTIKTEDEDDPDAATSYELRLRAEYDFEWTNDPIKVTTSIGGHYYSAILPDLKTLYNMPNHRISLKLDTGMEK